MPFIVYYKGNSVFLRAGTKLMLHQIFSRISKDSAGNHNTAGLILILEWLHLINKEPRYDNTMPSS